MDSKKVSKLKPSEYGQTVSEDYTKYISEKEKIVDVTISRMEVDKVL